MHHLGGVFGNAEVAIGFAWHNERLGLDRAEGLHQVASIHLVGADVGILPAPELCQQIVGIML